MQKDDAVEQLAKAQLREMLETLALDIESGQVPSRSEIFDRLDKVSSGRFSVVQVNHEVMVSEPQRELLEATIDEYGVEVIDANGS